MRWRRNVEPCTHAWTSLAKVSAAHQVLRDHRADGRKRPEGRWQGIEELSEDRLGIFVPTVGDLGGHGVLDRVGEEQVVPPDREQ